ncbi:MAG: hypothetical protein ACI9MC_003420, partial [Kiritimatiellia bacterium]
AISTYGDYGDVHTSAVALGWHLAGRSRGARVLLVNAGGGLTVGCALHLG